MFTYIMLVVDLKDKRRVDLRKRSDLHRPNKVEFPFLLPFSLFSSSFFLSSKLKDFVIVSNTTIPSKKIKLFSCFSLLPILGSSSNVLGKNIATLGRYHSVIQ